MEGAAKPPAAFAAAAGGDRAAALQAYAQRAAALREQALRTGSVTYQDVVNTAYAPGIVDPALLETKARWRATMGREFTFVADYTMLREDTNVQALVAIEDPNLQSTLVAQYESTLHVIGISPAATDFAIFHEAGHALQRATLRARGGAAGRRAEAPELVLDESLRASAADATAVHRLLYLSAQDEFEVRLQDLNRFHALLVADRPILQPMDCVRALTALGVPLEYAETRDAFALAGEQLSPEAFERAVGCTRVASERVAVAFEDARELGLVRRIARRVAPGCWPRLLAKIIFEAPGHL